MERFKDADGVYWVWDVFFLSQQQLRTKQPMNESSEIQPFFKGQSDLSGASAYGFWDQKMIEDKECA